LEIIIFFTVDFPDDLIIQPPGGPPPKRHKPNAAVVNEMHGQADNDFPLINDMDWGMDLGACWRIFFHSNPAELSLLFQVIWTLTMG
jgi:hypothetical protein